MAMMEASRPSTSPSASTRCQLRVTSAGLMDRVVFMISNEPLVGLGRRSMVIIRAASTEKSGSPIDLAIRYHITTSWGGQRFSPPPPYPLRSRGSLLLTESAAPENEPIL